MKSRAAVLYGPTRSFSIEEIEVDEPKEGEVLVKLVATGLCHSDWHFAKGQSPVRFPMVVGHEGAGIVEKVGPGVTEVKPGDHVVLCYIPACGKCRWCLSGLAALCDRGILLTQGTQLDGTFRMHKDGQDIAQFALVSAFSEYTVCPVDSVIKIDPDLPLDRACLVGCAVPTGWGAAVNRARVRPGETVAIFGTGGVGMNAVQGAAMAGAEKVIAIDLVDWKLEKAKEFGATHTINPTREDPVQRIMDITHGVGADATILTAGLVTPNLLATATRATRKAGRTVIVGLIGLDPNEPATHPLDLMFMLMAKEVFGTIFGHNVPRIDIPRLLDLYRDGKLKLDELVTHRYRLDQINQAYQDLEEGKVIRGVLLFD
ncbi:MAG: NDMA-dependent alcohol dehydrogenase [Thermomicrobium sp.]|nr:NDMA-dependent alcohol dehydrogenase [Thermomicrobium sp.]MDW8007237.1 NDMA-dependent alcohol dehydrogenase [Thermomicrobium sp.]